MKKVVASAAGILFAVFGIAILGLLISLTFSALGKLFPDNFTNQLWGLVLFDIAAMIWALAFVFKSESTMQYALAAIGFIAAFVGTLGMVAVEVMLSGQTYVEVQDWVGQWLVYGFVIMTAIHSALLYAHHAAAPNIHEKINVGIARGEITTEAIKQATQSLEVHKAALASSIQQEIVNQVRRDLGLHGQILDLPALPVEDSQETETKQGAPSWLLNFRRKFSPKNEPVKIYEQSIPVPIAQNKPAPVPTAAEEGQQAQPPTPFQGGNE